MQIPRDPAWPLDTTTQPWAEGSAISSSWDRNSASDCSEQLLGTTNSKGAGEDPEVYLVLQ